jgi:hypothetical protein
LAIRGKAHGLSHSHEQMTVKELLSVYEKPGQVDEAGMLK